MLRSLYFLISKENDYRRTFSEDRPHLAEVFLRYKEGKPLKFILSYL